MRIALLSTSIVDPMLHVWNIFLTFLSLIAFTDKEPKDFMVPSRWGTVSIPCRVSRLCSLLLTLFNRSTNAKIHTRPSNRVDAAQ